MARILLTWELGAQLSHLSNIENIARIAGRDGHQVGVALRELQHAHEFFPGLHLQYYQAPFKQGRSPALSSFDSYAHMLFTSGFANPRELAVLLSAWLGILHSFRPDVVIAEHSPTALLAARTLGLKRLLIGNGFLVPPLDSPLGIFPDVPRTAPVLERLEHDEAEVLAVVNHALDALRCPSLPRLSDIYGASHGRLLLTFPELDPFGPRPDAGYYGLWASGEKPRVTWPGTRKKKVFAYLGEFSGAATLLKELQARDTSTVVYAPGLPAGLRKEASGRNLRLLETQVDLDRVGEEADLFVSHGAHTSVARTLLKGCPQLMIPIYKEQLFTARRVRELGAGLVCSAEQESYAEALDALLDDPACAGSAMKFAERHRDFDPGQSQARISSLLGKALDSDG